MKQNLLILLIFILCIKVGNTQSIGVIFENNTINNGDTLIINGKDNDYELLVEFDIKNKATSGIKVNIKRNDILIAEGHNSVFCWAEQCYGPTTMISPNTVDIAEGETWEDDFSGHLYPHGHDGVSIISYTFFDVFNINDTSQVIVKYFAKSSLGNEESLSSSNNISVFPNPVCGELNISINENLSAPLVFELINTNGQIVKTINLRNKENKLTFNEIENGLYLYNIYRLNKAIDRGKIIVNK